MPPGLAITVVLLAACTFFALRPVRKPDSLSVPSYLMGFVVNEVPFAVFLFLILPSVALTVTDRNIDFPWAGIAAVCFLLLSGGLVAIWNRQRGVGEEVSSALEKNLGPGFRSELDDRQGRSPDRRPGRFRILCAPFPFGRFDVKRVGNQPYGDAGRRNLLDVYHHRSRPEGAPVLVYFHGGHFRGGHKRREGRPLILRLASQGWVCVSANYRLRPQATFPDYVVDAKRVIAWVRENSERFGADPASVFAAGSSAGGHMVSIAGLTQNEPAFQPGFEAADTSLLGFISLYGYYGGLARETDLPSSPWDYVNENAPPAFLVHGTLDNIVRADGARRFANRLREVSAEPVVHVELAGAQHGFDLLHSKRMERVTDGIVGWTESVLKRTSASGKRATPTDI